MRNSVKKLGNDFELELCNMLCDQGFWVHRMDSNQAGQPADIIAVRNNHAYLIDAKLCSKDSFSLSRIEENQKSAMEFWRECGNGEGWFAFGLTDGKVYLMSRKATELYSKTRKTLAKKDIELAMSLEDWVRKVD